VWCEDFMRITFFALMNGSLCCCQSILQVGDEHEGKHKDKILGGFFSALRGRGH